MTILVLALLLQLTGAAPQTTSPVTISGTVVDSKSAAPIANAELALSQIAGPTNLKVRTDAAGAFALPNIPAGRYYLLATHPDYLDQAYPGSSDSSLRGAVGEFTLAAGEQRRAAIRMLRGASISGRIFDSSRAPVANASVSPRILVPQNQGPSFLGTIQPGEGVGDINRLFVKTNERGEYRMTGLPPGQYYVGAAPSATTSTQAGAQTRQNNAATTYYPGYRNPDQAILVKVDAGEEKVGIDIALEPVPTLKVTGKITNSLVGETREGADYGYQFTLIPRNARVIEQPGSSNSIVPDFAPAADEFELRNVGPGTYDLFIAYSARPTNPRVGFVYQIGRATIDVIDKDVTDVRVAIVPGIDIPGQITLDESAKALLTDMKSLSFSLQPADALPRIYAPQLDSVRGAGVAADGSFVLPHATPGSYYLSFFLNPNMNAYVSGARFGTRDILSQPFEIENRMPDSFAIEISGQAGRIEGVVTDRDSKPAARARIVLVPSVEVRPDGSSFRIGGTNAQGRYSLVGIRPGSYTVYAFAQIADGAWNNSTFMSQFAASGVSVIVDRNGRIQRDLKLIP